MGYLQKGGSICKKDNVDKDTVKSILKTGVDYAVPDDYKDLAKSGVNLGVDVGYGRGLLDNLKRPCLSSKIMWARIPSNRL